MYKKTIYLEKQSIARTNQLFGVFLFFNTRWHCIGDRYLLMVRRQKMNYENIGKRPFLECERAFPQRTHAGKDAAGRMQT